MHPRPADPLRGRLALMVACALAAALLAVPAAPPGVAAEPGCTLTATGGTVTRMVGTRSYELHVPPGLSGPEVPLLLSLHGFGSSGWQVEMASGWSDYAGQHDFIVAYPNALPSSGFGAWDPYTGSTSDVEFLRQVVDDISATWCVDPHRVHADGWSNGAVMSQRVACEAAHTFASVTSYAGGTPTPPGADPCNPSRPISVGLFVGAWDFTYAGLAANTDEWVARNQCSPTPGRTTDPHGTLDTYSCAEGTQVLARVVSETSHEWPSGAKGEDQRNRMWAFFEANPLP